MGLNEPFFVQYGVYITDLLKGDLGTSLQTKAPIAREIWSHITATFELTFFAMLFATVIGVNAGIISAWKQNTWFDFLAMVFALIGEIGRASCRERVWISVVGMAADRIG